MNKPKGPDEMCLRILRKLAKEVNKPLSIYLRSYVSPVKFPLIRKGKT